MPGVGKYEFLQLSTILNNAYMFEINAPKFNEPLLFSKTFKDTIISAVALNNLSYIVISDQTLRDSLSN